MNVKFFVPLAYEINTHTVSTQSWSMWGEG